MASVQRKRPPAKVSVQESGEPPKKVVRKSPTPPLKDTNAPKKPPASSFIFFNKERAEVVEKLLAKHGEKPTKKETFAALAVAWATLDPERKAVIEKKASVLKIAHRKSVDVYRKTPEYRRHQEAMKTRARETLIRSKAHSDSAAEVGPPAHAEGRSDTTSEAELAKIAKCIPDHILLRELQCRLAVSATTRPGFTELADHTSSAASAASPASVASDVANGEERRRWHHRHGAADGAADGEDEGEMDEEDEEEDKDDDKEVKDHDEEADRKLEAELFASPVLTIAEVEAPVLPPAADSGSAAQAVPSFEKSSGYKCWYNSKVGKDKIKEDMGSVPKSVVRREAKKRWLQLSECARGQWENTAVTGSES